MASLENEYFLRCILLLNEGGLYILKKILAREVNKHGGDLDSLLKNFEGGLRSNLHKKQFEKLFPDYGTTDVEKWDLQMMIKVIVNAFRNSLTEAERRNLRILLYQRNNVFAHSKPALNVGDYEDYKKDLQEAINGLAAAFDLEVKDRCREFIRCYESGPLDIKSASDNIQAIRDNDAMLSKVLNEIDVVKKTTSGLEEIARNGFENMGSKLTVIEQLLNGLKPDDNQKHIEVEVQTELKLSCSSKEWVDLAEKTLNTIFNTAGQRVGNNREDIEREVDNLLGLITSKATFKGSEVKCVMLKFQCTSYASLQWLLEYFQSTDFQTHLERIAAALMKYLNIKGEVTITSNFTEGNLQNILEIIEKGIHGSEDNQVVPADSDKSEEAVEHTRALRLAMECTSLEGLQHVWNLFQRGDADEHLNRIANALSKHFGVKVSLKAHLDINQFKKAIEESVGQKEVEVVHDIEQDTQKDMDKDSGLESDLQSVKRPVLKSDPYITQNTQTEIVEDIGKEVTEKSDTDQDEFSFVEINRSETELHSEKLSNEMISSRSPIESSGDKQLIAQLKDELETCRKRIIEYETIFSSIKEPLENEITSVKQNLQELKQTYIDNSKTLLNDFTDLKTKVVKTLKTYENPQEANRLSGTFRSGEFVRRSESAIKPMTLTEELFFTEDSTYIAASPTVDSVEKEIEDEVMHEFHKATLLLDIEIERHAQKLKIISAKSRKTIPDDEYKHIAEFERTERQFVQQVKEKIFAIWKMKKKADTRRLKSEANEYRLASELEIVKMQLKMYQSEGYMIVGSEWAGTMRKQSNRRISSEHMDKREMLLRINALERIAPDNDDDIDDMTGKDLQIDKVSITSCHIGDLVLLCHDKRKNQYVVFNVGTLHYFLHSDSYEGLGLHTEVGESKKQWILATVTDKEYCMASKTPNKFGLNLGAVFYMVKAIPWKLEDTTSPTTVEKPTKPPSVGKTTKPASVEKSTTLAGLEKTTKPARVEKTTTSAGVEKDYLTTLR